MESCPGSWHLDKLLERSRCRRKNLKTTRFKKGNMNVSCCSDVLLHKDEKMLDQGDGGRLGGWRRLTAAGGEAWREGVRVDEP